MIPIYEITSGTRVKIVSMPAGKHSVRQLHRLGLFEGDIVKVISNTHGPLIIAKGHLRFALGRGIGKHLLVEACKEAEL